MVTRVKKAGKVKVLLDFIIQFFGHATDHVSVDMLQLMQYKDRRPSTEAEWSVSQTIL